MTQVVEDRGFPAVQRARRQHSDETLTGRRQPDRAAVAKASEPERGRLPATRRYALRDAIAYAVETPEGDLGFVTGIEIAPFEYWPYELLVEDAAGVHIRVPTSTVSAVAPREGRLRVTRAPAGARSAPRPRQARLTKAWAWRYAAVTGAVFAFGGYVATFVALILGTGVSWGPGLAAGGAAGGAAAAASWRKRGPSWPAALGLGSFWLPLAAGAILSLVLVFR